MKNVRESISAMKHPADTYLWLSKTFAEKCIVKWQSNSPYDICLLYICNRKAIIESAMEQDEHDLRGYRIMGVSLSFTWAWKWNIRTAVIWNIYISDICMYISYIYIYQRK